MICFVNSTDSFSMNNNHNNKKNTNLPKDTREIKIVTEHDKSRRNTINAVLASFYSTKSSIANAAVLPFGSNNNERRQLELCLVSILRVKYWAEIVAISIAKNIENTQSNGITDIMKAPYLEAKLGSKAILTGKIGGGASSKVYSLAPLKLKECIKDALSWYNELYYNQVIKDPSITSDQKAFIKNQRSEIQNASIEIIESLAAVVEFDGLDNTQDPSPRSSLALSMYTDAKAMFVKRLLLERTVLNCDIFVNCFGVEKRQFCERYIKSTYPNEVPISLIESERQIIIAD